MTTEHLVLLLSGIYSRVIVHSNIAADAKHELDPSIAEFEKLLSVDRVWKLYPNKISTDWSIYHLNLRLTLQYSTKCFCAYLVLHSELVQNVIGDARLKRRSHNLPNKRCTTTLYHKHNCVNFALVVHATVLYNVWH